MDDLKVLRLSGRQRSDPTDAIVQVGPVTAKGGIASVIHSVLESGEVQKHYRIVMIGTSLYRDAPAWREFGVSAKALFRFGKLLLFDRSIALVHIHSSGGVSLYRKSLFASMARCAGIPYVFHIHTGRILELLDSGPGMRRWVLRGVLGQAARVVVLSPAFAARVRQTFPGVATEVLSNPVKLPRDWWGCSLRNATEGPPRVLYVGFLLPSKGVMDLVDAVRTVVSRVPVELRLCGKGPLEADLAEVAAHEGAGWLKVVGWVEGDRLLEEYAEAGVFALASAGEGVPMSMLDAMASGLPCVATRVGGIPSIVDDGVEGYLVDVGDVQTLAERLECLARDSGLRDRMGQRAMERATAHTPDRIAGEWVRMYEATLTDTQPRHLDKSSSSLG